MGKCENEAADIYYCGDKDLSAVNCTLNEDVISFAGKSHLSGFNLPGSFLKGPLQKSP